MHTQAHNGPYLLPCASPSVDRGTRRPRSPVARLDDRELVARSRAGDMRALGILLAQYRPQIERICRRMCKGDDSFDDVLQETYLGIVRSIGSFRGDSAFLTWVYTIARTFRGRHVRKATRRQNRMDEFERSFRSAELDFERLAAGHQLGMAIDAALASLSPLDRTILLARDADGLTAVEVAKRTGLTVPAVKTRLHRARVTVRERLDTLRAELGCERPKQTAA